MKILGLCGSLQASSSNRTLLETAASLAPEGVELVLYDGLRALPQFDPDLDARGAPAEVAELRTQLAGADALMITCPEYGHSMPGSLKNAIDWVIGSGELEQKIVAITAAVSHPERGRLGLGALRGTLGAVSARVVGGEPIVRGDEGRPQIAALLESLIAAVRAERDVT
ncbi:MAG: NAD(P)H-dependent oxidoreductase [Myxococcota bacterium]|nr:NAD(P)H-dependent oxidoreductase [Myxococcota bacterium]